MKKIIFLFLVILINLQVQSHPWKPAHYVIIDTDGGIDDMRSISMMLASPNVRVLAVIASPGALSAENAYLKVRSMLNSFFHEGIPVGINRNRIYISKNLPVALQYNWGDENGIDPLVAPEYLKVITDVFKYEKTKISFVCLGGMATCAEAIRKIPEFKSQVKQIVWSCNGLNDTKGFNFSIDSNAAREVLGGAITVKAVKSTDNFIFYDDNLIACLEKINTRYGKNVLRFMQSEAAKNHQFSLNINDELIPLYLHYPELFLTIQQGNNSEITPSDLISLKDRYLKILKGETAVKNQVIKELPEDPDFYFDDIKPFVSEIIERYGEDEWQSGVLANELHRHLGVFAIIGVKMGIRAREYFNTGVDEFEAVSFAGSVSPLSCMNDGIQVSTGATPGHGLLSVRNDTPLPAAEFKYMNHRIKLTLKPDLAKKISGELKEINFVYGLDSDIYWELVRKNAIKYWRDFDRHEIFDIEVIQ